MRNNAIDGNVDSVNNTKGTSTLRTQLPYGTSHRKGPYQEEPMYTGVASLCFGRTSSDKTAHSGA